jgi:thiamine pyrophosphokinase
VTKALISTPSSGSTTLVLIAARAGDPVSASDLAVPSATQVIAVDSGLHLAVALGLHVDVVIGDMDSAEPALVARARAAGAQIELHPRDKEHTDLGLGLARAAADAPDTIVVLGGAGGRLDHALANLLVLADASLAAFTIRAHLGGADICVVRDRAVHLRGAPGSLLSLLAIGGPAQVRTSGLAWDLHDEELQATASRGVSNEILSDQGAEVIATSGVLLAIQPAQNEALEL